MGDVSAKDASKFVKIAGEDENPIGNIGDSFKVYDTKQWYPSDTPGCGTVSSKLRHDFSEVDITVPSTFTTVYSYTGSGKLFSGGFQFDDSAVRLKLTVDGEIIFNMTMTDAELFSDSNGSFVKAKVADLLYEFDVKRCPMVYLINVRFEVQRTDGSDHKMQRSAVTLTKET